MNSTRVHSVMEFLVDKYFAGTWYHDILYIYKLKIYVFLYCRP